MNNRQHPAEVDDIEDRDIKRQMAAWVGAFTGDQTKDYEDLLARTAATHSALERLIGA